MGSDVTQAPRRIGRQLERTVSDLSDVSHKINREIQRPFERLGRAILPGVPDITFPEQTTVTPVESVQREAEAAQRDMLERQKRAKGRAASNQRIPNIARPLVNRPQLGRTLG